MAASKECIVQRIAGYTVMSNHHLRDKRLSLKSKGLLSVILSLPEDWDYTIAGLALICDCGRDMIREALKELTEAGYVSRERMRTEGGQLAGTQYTIREIPVEAASPMSDFPTQVKPTLEEPTLGNPTELIKEELITDESNPPKSPEVPKTPRKTGSRKKAEKPDPDAFDRFWAAYPLKVGKKKARDAFAKVRVPVDVLLAALERQKKTEAWTKAGGQYIPHPTTWLNGERWEDEVKAAPAPGGGRMTPAAPSRGGPVGEVWDE